jgi:hypothetical protein
MSTVDYTPVLLAQITDLSMRVTNLEATNAALKAEVERLTGHTLAVKPISSVKTSVPLTSTMHTNTGPNRRPYESAPRGGFQPPNGFQPSGGFQLPNGFHPAAAAAPRRHLPSAEAARAAAEAWAAQRPPRQPKAQPQQRDNYKQLTIQDVLHLNEEVTIQVRTAQEDESIISHTTCVTVFDGVELKVTACELAPELVGLSSTKPGEILYKFIESLTKGGHIKRAFSTAPWKLCFVERDGKRLSLEDLRK